MAKKKKEDEQAAGAPLWMATFGDLMSLLLTFFVLLLSFSTIEEYDFNAAMGSLKGALGLYKDPYHKLRFINRERARPISYRFRFVRHGEVVENKRQKIPLFTKTSAYKNDLTDFSEEMTTFSQGEGIANMVSVDFYEQGVKLRLPTVLLFERGQSTIKDDEKTKNLLQKIIAMLKALDYSIHIEGHTDDQMINNPRYNNNWELSAKRALSVLYYFVDEGDIDPQRLKATACAQYQPFTDNKTMLGRKLNRRVEINIDVSKT